MENENNPSNADDLNKKIAELEERLKRTNQRQQKIKQLRKKASGGNRDLLNKTRYQSRVERKKARLDEKIENSISFNYGLQDYYEKNRAILGDDIEKIIKVASEEKYDGHINKARAIKSAIVQSFFEKQENVDLLTASQKKELDRFQSLVKNKRDDEVLRIYTSLFEPVMAMKKEVARAKEIAMAKQGYAPTSDVQTNYKRRLIDQANRVHRKINKAI